MRGTSDTRQILYTLLGILARRAGLVLPNQSIYDICHSGDRWQGALLVPTYTITELASV